MIMVFIIKRLWRYGMPAGDGRGPMGAGSMTGRGAGFCAGYDVPGYVNTGRGCGYYGYGRGGRGAGMGWRNRPYGAGRAFGARRFQGAPYGGGYEYSAEAELSMLREQAEYINERIKALQSAASGKQEND